MVVGQASKIMKSARWRRLCKVVALRATRRVLVDVEWGLTLIAPGNECTDTHCLDIKTNFVFQLVILHFC